MVSIVAERSSEEHAEYEAQRKRFRGDREKHEKFVELYLERSANFQYENYLDMLRSCYKDAGWHLSTSATYDAKQVLRRNWPQIEEELRKRISGGAVVGIHTIIHLCKHASSDAVRLKAAVELINKGGFAEVQKIQVSQAENLSEEDLNQQIRDAMEAAGLQVVSTESP